MLNNKNIQFNIIMVFSIMVLFLKDLGYLSLPAPIYYTFFGIIPFILFQKEKSLFYLSFLVPFLGGLPANYIILLIIIIFILRSKKLNIINTSGIIKSVRAESSS